MTKEAIVEEVRKLSLSDRREVLNAISQMDERDWELTDEEKALVDKRWKRMQKDPDRTLNYDELKDRVRSLTTK